MTAPRAIIVGVAGPALTADERRFLAEARPFGLIVFERNLQHAGQIIALIDEFRTAVDAPDAPVLIDQEGGRVQRLAPPLAPRYPAARRFGELEAAEPGAGARAAFLAARLIAADLAPLGITVDCLPVLDVPADGAHRVIGERAYASAPEIVARLGRAAVDGLMAGGVLPVVKHVPGHGRARADSHLALPTVDAPRETLERTDFAPFRALNDVPFGMTAHIRYTALDAKRTATLSPVVIGECIRESIGFTGCLMSDDVSMRALSGGLARRTREAIAAGCDLVLHCNGSLREMRKVADAAPELSGEAARRAAAALAARRPPQPFDADEARAELDGLLGAARMVA